MSSTRGVLLDVDGTLVDSNDAHAHAWVKAFSGHGFDVPFEKIRRMIGMGGDKIISEVTGLTEDSPVARQLSERRKKIFLEEFLPSLRPLPKVRELLSLMRARGLKLVVASSATTEELQGLLKVCGADGLIESKTSSDDAERSKPDPDIVSAALEEIALPPSQVVMLGDTPYDVEAAKRGCVSIIALLCGGWSRADLAGALAIFKDPADLLENFDSSPLGRSSH
jgi:HAD superfamily hydrolase (TIGR01509 family)